MLNFTYFTPTRVLFGRDTESLVGDEIAGLGCRKALVHFGGGSAKKSGLIDRIHASLDKAGVGYVDLGGVKPNPMLGLVREGIELCRREGVDFLLGVGGGSAIDSAKAIAYGAADPELDVWDIFIQKAKPRACLPVGAVVTIAAAGSEMSNSAVITNEDGMLKRGSNYDICRPKFAVMNPELTFTLPEYQTMCGVVDIMMHTLERYFSNDKQAELTDRVAEAVMKTVLITGPKLLKNPRDYDARAEIMWAGSLSHNGLTGAGKTSDFASHQIQMELSGMFDVAHGAGLAVIWPSWARYVYKHDVARFAQLAVRVMGLPMNFDNPEETALAGIDAMERFFRDLRMPVTLAELGLPDVTDAQIDEMTYKCTWNNTRTRGEFVKLNMEDIGRIYRMARK